MKKTFTIIFLNLALASANLVQATPTSFKCDFSGGIPSSFALYDQDGCTPSKDMTLYGFSVGTPWIAVTEEKSDNIVAASTSWYTPAGTSEDWLIAPAVNITSEECSLKWRSRAYDKSYSDGYAVYISTTGNRPEDFDISSPVFSTDKDSSSWQTHEVSLADYIGQDIYVAWVNNSTDCSRLYLDDIYIGANCQLDIFSDMATVMEPGETVIRGHVQNIGDAEITSFRAGYEIDGQEYSQTFACPTMSSGEIFQFAFDQPAILVKNSRPDITLWVEYDGKQTSTMSSHNIFSHKIVSEEGTGTWCGWCVRGIVMLEKTLEVYPNNFIPIAVHGGNDPMRDNYYNEQLENMAFNGYPFMSVDRVHSADPSYCLELTTTRLGMGCKYGIGLTSQYDADAKTILVDATVYTIAANTDPMLLTFAVIEDDVYCPDDPTYTQHNYYYDNRSGEMGGYENKPEYLLASEMHYMHVARHIEEFYGIPGSLPEQMLGGMEYTYSHQIEMPETILNPANVSVVALLLNTKTKAIENAEICPIALPAGVSVITADQDDQNQGVKIFDLSGRMVYQGIDAPAAGSITKGVYIIQEGTPSRKALIR